jgi:hypothetical protein
VWRAYSLQNFTTQRRRELASQPMNQRLYRSKTHPEALGCIFVGDAGLFAFQKWRERFEHCRFPILSKVCSDGCKRAIQEKAGPPGIEQFGRTQFLSHAQVMKLFGFQHVHGNHLEIPSALEGMAAGLFVREANLEGAQKKISEPALITRRSTERFVFKHVLEKRLSEVLSILGVIPMPP